MRAKTAVLMLLATAPALADTPVPPADAAEIGRIITAQIEAFRHDDAAAAFAFASPGIQQKLGDSTHFIQAVRQAYPQVYRPRSVQLGALDDTAGRVTQQVRIVGPDGALVTAVYDLEHEADGTWRIAGCSLSRSVLRET